MRQKLTVLPFLLLIPILLAAQTAPNFMVTDAHANTHRLYEDYLNQGKTVVLELFFTTCPPCNSIAPQFQSLYEDWGEGTGDVQFIGLSVLSTDNNTKVIDYEDRHGLTFPGAGSEGGSLDAVGPYKDGTFGFYIGTPTFVVIAPDGSVNYGVRGSGNAGTIDAIDQAIAATGAVKPNTLLPSMLSGQVNTFRGRAIPEVRVWLAQDPTKFAFTDSTGHFEFEALLDEGITYRLLAEKDDDFNAGITTFDMVLLRKHILRLDTFEHVAQLFAADANENGGITTFDMVLFSKLILFVSNNLGSRTSPWIFLREGMSFTDYLDNPGFHAALEFTTADDLMQLNFTGAKAGDINDSVNLE